MRYHFFNIYLYDNLHKITYFYFKYLIKKLNMIIFAMIKKQKIQAEQIFKLANGKNKAEAISGILSGKITTNNLKEFY